MPLHAIYTEYDHYQATSRPCTAMRLQRQVGSWPLMPTPLLCATCNNITRFLTLTYFQPNSSKRSGSAPLNVPETAKLAALLYVFYFTANWFQNSSFVYTTVASSTILTSMSGVYCQWPAQLPSCICNAEHNTRAAGFFTLFIGPFLGVGSFKWSKLISVAIRLVSD
jgi:hypothetical protein